VVFYLGTLYDIRTAVIVAQDETRATVVQHCNPKVFGLKRPPIFSHAGSRGGDWGGASRVPVVSCDRVVQGGVRHRESVNSGRRLH